ncbi:type III secretion apparatus [Pandoraea terrae]|uniref:Type III secretion apparatus n=1 Tax=Pandoraea terrae TaxID=1537710 RepID=A0A5E4ZCV6_9BURK|nr:EscG/YscG/SsaH family type III secretion system needle protein co-chaperone [Pandoraea terrae]VVE59211.1 type III secretion apparatus [Pandoraea terrae]
MSVPLTATLRRLIVEAGLAAAHHGLASEADAIMAALPALVPDPDAARRLHAACLIALGRGDEAAACLRQDASTEACALRQWIGAARGRGPHSLPHDAPLPAVVPAAPLIPLNPPRHV